MIYPQLEMEQTAILQTAAKMCAAARTAPKANGTDSIVTLVLTGEDKDRLAEAMEAHGIRHPEQKAWYDRDAGNVRASGAVVLIGAKHLYRDANHCGMCGFGDCGNCAANGGRCLFTGIDLGVALGAAARAASEDYVDSRIMFSIGKAAMDMGLQEGIIWHGIPLSVSSKSGYFDRKPIY